MPESLLGLASLIGGLVGGVSGLSFVGLSALPLSSVMPRPLPEPLAERLASEVAGWGSAIDIAAGEEVVAESLTLKRALLID